MSVAHFTLRLEDNEEFVKALGEFESKLPKIERRVVGKLLSLAKKDVKTNHLRGQDIKKQEGTLAKSIIFKTYSDGYGYIRANSFYASFLQDGAHIEAKTAAGLRFKVDGEWKRVHEVTLPGRPWFTQPVSQYFNKNKGVEEADKVLQDALNKLFGVQ